MTNSNGPLSLSTTIGSGAAKRPFSLLHNRIPFNMAALAASSGSLYSSTPNWTRLTGDDDADTANDDAQHEGAADADAASDTDANITILNELSAGADPPTSNIGLEPTYSTPYEASTAYQSGLLKSDFNISSNQPSIRLAFRHLLNEDGEEKDEKGSGGRAGKSEEEDTLFLCWVRQDGIPCHFRRMRPVHHNVSSAEVVAEEGNAMDDGTGEEEHGNLRGAPSNKESKKQSSLSSSRNHNDTATTTMLVNENDHIETTFPGHAFVFCRRVEYDHSGNTGSNGDESHSNEDDTLVVNANGKTYFLRKRKCNDENNEENEETKSESTEGDDVAWESFLVVGGFRPGPMPEMMDVEGDDDSEAHNNGGDEVVSGGNDERIEEGKAEESSDDDDSSDDDSFDGRELRVQLVTIHSVRSSAKSTRINNHANGETEVDDDVLPSKVLGCSDCTQSVPCLRGAMNPKPHHTPAFVATSKMNGDVDVDVASLELPPHNGNETTDEDCDTLEVTVCMTQLDPTPLDTSSKHYDEVILGGWPCRTEPGCFPSDMDVPENGRNLLRSRFEADLLAASESLPPEAREQLRISTPVWINKSQSFGPRAAPVKARDGCFHPGSEWLVRNGMNPAKCGGVEWYDAKHYLSDCDLWGPGGLMLHELSHAWHCLHIEDGYDNEEIIDVYTKAMEDGLYESVRVHGPQGPRCKAYACTDQMEYFAELSAAFLGGLDEDREHNKWYPFNRAQLREHDPRAFAMLCRMWGVEDDSLGDDQQSSAQEGGGEASKEG